MNNQVTHWQRKGVRCVALHQESEVDLQSLQLTSYEIIFTSPEMALSQEFRTRMTLQFRQSVCVVAFDEAHCIAEWGLSQFRPQYANVTELMSLVSHAPVLVTTATLSETMREEIFSVLHLSQYETIAINPDRPEIYIDVKLPDKHTFDWLVKALIVHKQDTPKTIVYCRSINQVTTVFERFLSALHDNIYVDPDNKVPDNRLVEMFSSAIVESSKTRILSAFSTGSNLRVVISTVAFGMGIDIPDIRNVILWGIPAGVCQYWQEVGRACRDGQPGRAMIVMEPVPSKLPRSEELKALFDSHETCYRKAILEKLWLLEMGDLPKSQGSCSSHCRSCNCIKCTCCTVCRDACPCNASDTDNDD